MRFSPPWESPLCCALAALIAVIAPRPTFALDSPAVSSIVRGDTSPNPEGYEPYLSFPHGTRTGHAFLPFQPDDPIHPLLANLSLPDNPTNPAYPPPQWANNRHPLYTPGKPAPKFKTEEFQFDPIRLDKRKVVSSVPVEFPPSACEPVILLSWIPLLLTDARGVLNPAGIDINDLSTIATLAQAAVARMQTWYEGGVFECVSRVFFFGDIHPSLVCELN